ncbi:PQQ-dependent sugar dehydrogenase [Inhella crocodyli]|uniref:PQQ-dependent sugar dehydrogenase n=1 Tax=Inhella crocodyli TaxID=2499851 RepID=A0A3S2WV81_9BURK|nr:PQQ-dependent sugar dehydrogenase [Inhella crocodyli]RVT88797.1 PQQ-dependent sugar dehydrogenase [Inhella crocodyli]
MPLRSPHAAWIAAVAALLLAACGGGGGAPPAAPAPPPPPAPTPPPAPAPTPTVTTLRSDLANPWALARLPDGRWLLTERAGRLWVLSADARSKTEVTGLPAVASAGQGGLLDVAVDPDFAQAGGNHIYWSYAEPGSGGNAGTAVARALLSGNTLGPVQVIFRQSPKVGGSGHFGSRLVFARDKTLFVTLGERQLGNPAQDLQQTLGKVVRLQRDGSLPGDNPRWTLPALPGVWSLGHRNPQGAALHPDTGELWVSEHGPQGGDELNIARAGANFGWPLRSYGCNYGDPVGEACRIGGGVHAPGYVEPLTHWVPTSIAPSNLIFHSGTMFPEWRGQVLMGSLAGSALWRLVLSGNTVVARERLLGELGERIRDVDEAPDGAIWLLTDSGKLLRYGR